MTVPSAATPGERAASAVTRIAWPVAPSLGQLSQRGVFVGEKYQKVGFDSAPLNGSSTYGGDVGFAVLGGVLTDAVAAEVAVTEPTELLAVTETRIVDPTSADTREYAVPVAPVIGAQSAPPESQRCH